MKVLVACEYSGTVRDAFIAKGHDAISCDLLPTDKPGPHYQGSVFDIIDDGFDLLIAHPPCTYLCNSGVQHLYKEVGRHAMMLRAAIFFKFFLNCSIPKKAVENPRMHRYGKQMIGRHESQTIDPTWFGHMETKATCLWLDGLRKLVATNDVREETKKLPAKERQRLHYLPPSEDRWKIRSQTYKGVAEAMAEQWG